MNSRIRSLIMTVFIAPIVSGCGNYELLSMEELDKRGADVRKETTRQVESRMSNEFARQEMKIKEDTRKQLLTELEAAKKSVAPANTTPGNESDNNLRNTRWGMKQEEVIAVEGKNHLQRTASTLVYKSYTAGLPSLIKYIFEGDRLVKADIQFSNPKLSSALPIRPKVLVEADYHRMYDLLSDKYGSAQITTQLFSRVTEMKRQKERIDDSIVEYQRQLDDLKLRRDRKREDFRKQYKDWKDSEEIVRKKLEEDENNIRRCEDLLTEAKRQQADVEPKIREEEFNEQDGILPHTTVCRWYKPSAFDITLSWTSSRQGEYLASRYNGFITPNLSAAPSDF